VELIRGVHNLRAEHKGCVATIGNFDGVHLGHQQVLENVKQAAQRLGLPSTVISFEPLPREFFLSAKSPTRLDRLREKCTALAAQQVDRFLCLTFNHGFASQDPNEFIKDVLVEGLGIKYLVVGDDFRFGKDRAGDFALLKAAGERYGFDVVDTQTVMSNETRISSTRIRECLKEGELQEARSLLGRWYSMQGRVAHGDKRGRTIGFPTANIQIHRKVTPVSGVFVVKVNGLPGGEVHGVANVGVRPTFTGDTKAVLEVHLFDFNQEIYGEYVDVAFLHKIRQEVKFDSMEALVAQIHEDTQQAKDWFANFHGSNG
jgi:riboflavin kinase/FMN adenylyltransferase